MLFPVHSMVQIVMAGARPSEPAVSFEVEVHPQKSDCAVGDPFVCDDLRNFSRLHQACASHAICPDCMRDFTPDMGRENAEEY